MRCPLLISVLSVYQSPFFARSWRRGLRSLSTISNATTETPIGVHVLKASQTENVAHHHSSNDRSADASTPYTNERITHNDHLRRLVTCTSHTPRSGILN